MLSADRVLTRSCQLDQLFAAVREAQRVEPKPEGSSLFAIPEESKEAAAPGNASNQYSPTTNDVNIAKTDFSRTLGYALDATLMP